jgi:hypothetical protein
MSESEQLELDFYQFKDKMRETANNLKLLRECMDKMRWQFGGTGLPEFEELSKEVDASINGWMSSVC